MRRLACAARRAGVGLPRGLATGSGRGIAAVADEALAMRVRSEVGDFGKLAGGIWARARDQRRTELDAMGDAAVANAVKAVAIANVFASQEGAPGVAFVASMLTGDEDRRCLRLSVSPRPPGAEAPPSDFSHGGIYVPADHRAAGARGAASASSRTAKTGEAPRTATPTELSKTVLGQWLRFAAPELHTGMRSEERAPGPRPARQKAPFLLSMGPLPLSRAAKALAFASSDLASARHLAEAPAFAVVPCFWEKKGKDPRTGLDKVSKVVVLWLARAQ